MAIACGGVAQFFAGMWEFACGNTFGATAFTSYGAFWIAYALIFIPGTGVLAAYTDPKVPPADLGNAVAFFLTAWFIFTFCMFIASLRTSIALIALFFCLDLTFMFLMISEYSKSPECQKIGGALGLVTAAIAYYTGVSGLLTRESAYFMLPAGEFPKPRYATV